MTRKEFEAEVRAAVKHMTGPEVIMDAVLQVVREHLLSNVPGANSEAVRRMGIQGDPRTVERIYSAYRDAFSTYETYLGIRLDKAANAKPDDVI